MSSERTDEINGMLALSEMLACVEVDAVRVLFPLLVIQREVPPHLGFVMRTVLRTVFCTLIMGSCMMNGRSAL